MANELTQWKPPQEKYVRWAINGLLGLIGVGVAASLVKRFTPTLVDAVNLLNTLLSSMTNLVITGAVLLVVGWLALETFTPGGRINQLVAQFYSSLTTKLTWELLNIDPLSPLYDKKREAEEKKQVFDDAIARLHGILGHWKQKEHRYREDAEVAERKARAAQKIAAEHPDDPTKKLTFQRYAYDAGSFRETAQRYGERQARLSPVAKNLVQVQGALTVMIGNMETDIRTARDEWEASKDMLTAESAAKGVLRSSREELAQNAMELIQQRYGEAFGRLEHLSELTKPMLDSIDLDRASYSEELLQKWQAESQLLITGPKGDPVPVSAPSTQQSDFARLAR